MFKSTNGMCSHCLLIATLNGEVDMFVQTHSRLKNPVNYTQLGQHELPVGGKKPSYKRKASSKKTTAKIRKAIAHTDVRTKRGQSSTSTAACCPTGSGSSPMSDASHMVVTSPLLPPPNVYSVGISSPYANFGGASVSSAVLAMQQPPPLLNTAVGQPLSVLGTSSIQPQPSNTQSMLPPPLYHQSPEQSVGQPFRVVFSNSRISKCQGCRGQIDHNSDQIVIQHKEHVLFQNPHTGRWQMSRELRNTYYHTRLACLTLKHPNFSPCEIQLGVVEKSLDPASLHVLRTEFGLIM